MKQEKIFSKKIVYGSFGVFFLFVIVLSLVAIYTRYATNDKAQHIAGFLHLPVVVTLNPFSVLTATQLQWKLASLKQFYEKQDFSALEMRVDFTTEDGKKRLRIRERGIINKSIEDAVIEDVVRASDEQVTETEITQSVLRKLYEFDSEESVKNNLKHLYGWDIEDFQREVVRPDLYKEKVTKIFDIRQDTEGRNREASQKIAEALEQLKSGMSFKEVARKYSEGSTIEEGGEIGWIDSSRAEPNLAAAIEKLSVGERTDSIETSLGYHIVQLHEIRKEAGVKLYRVSQIIVRKETLADWINDFIRKTSVWVFLPEYEWNPESGYVEFSNPVMTDFEKKNSLEEKKSLL